MTFVTGVCLMPRKKSLEIKSSKKTKKSKKEQISIQSNAVQENELPILLFSMYANTSDNFNFNMFTDVSQANVTSSKEEVEASHYFTNDEAPNSYLHITDDIEEVLNEAPSAPQVTVPEIGDYVIQQIDLLLSKEISQATVQELLKAVPWDENTSLLVFYLSSPSHFNDRMRKILRKKSLLIPEMMDLQTPEGKKNMLESYLQLKHAVNDNSLISELSCEELLPRLQKIEFTQNMKAITWLLNGGKNSIFYRLVKTHWDEIQRDEKLNEQWGAVLTTILNSKCGVKIKTDLLTEIMKLPLSSSWMQVLFYYLNNKVWKANRHWLINCLDDFIAERKNAFIGCFKLIMREAKDTYFINLSNKQAILVQELLEVYKLDCFVLTSVGDYYQINQITRKNCERLRAELRMSLAIRMSLITHRDILKEIFAGIGKANIVSTREISAEETVFLNIVYENYFLIKPGEGSSFIYFIDRLACQPFLQLLGLDITIENVNKASQITLGTFKKTRYAPKKKKEDSVNDEISLMFVLTEIAKAKEKTRYIEIAPKSIVHPLALNKKYKDYFCVHNHCKPPCIEIINLEGCKIMLDCMMNEFLEIPSDSLVSAQFYGQNSDIVLENATGHSDAHVIQGKETSTPVTEKVFDIIDSRETPIDGSLKNAELVNRFGFRASNNILQDHWVDSSNLQPQ